MTDAAKLTRVSATPLPIKTTLGNTVPKRSEEETELVILPDPVGYQMLVALPTMTQKTAMGIIIPETVNERERAASVVGTVIAMGSECYADRKKFPSGAWCKVGDNVLFSRYQGMRFRSKDAESGDMVEYRMLSDDGIVGTVPEGAEVGGL
jgi:co-chaperonin GroES (HSP10)